MNILNIVTWYFPKNASIKKEGIFHFEQVTSLNKLCNNAIYFPYDNSLPENFSKQIEDNILTYRRKESSNKFLKILLWIKDLIYIKRTFKPDIIHCHVAARAGKLGLLAKNIFGIQLVVTEHNPVELSNLDQKKIYSDVHKVYKNSSVNICVSPNLKNQLTNIFPDISFSVLCNGIQKPDSMLTDSVIYKKEGFINCVIVAAFYNKEIKGYQFLLPAIKKLIEQNKKIILHICGGGEFLNYYRELSQTLGIENNVIFYDQCNKEKVYNIVSQCDFLLSTSLFESGGVSVEEALILGKPVLVTNSGGPDSIINNECGIIIEKGSTESIVNGINKIINSLTDFDEKKIKEFALNNFEIDNISQKYFELYKTLIKE